MTNAIIDHRTPDGRSPTSVWLLRDPIDLIAEDHLRLRAMCAEMDRLADAGEVGPEEFATLVEYLAKELPDLLLDEGAELMPLVLRRADPEDELPKLAERLVAEHTVIEKHLFEVFGPLSEHPGRAPLPGAVRAGLRALAAAMRRHLLLENAVLLPLARARLTQDDLVALSKAMLRRRGLDDLFSYERRRDEMPRETRR